MRRIGLLLAVLVTGNCLAREARPPSSATQLTGRWQVVRVVTMSQRPGQEDRCDSSTVGGLQSLTFGRKRLTREFTVAGARVVTRERCRVRGAMLVSGSLTWRRPAEGTVGWTTYELSAGGSLLLTVFEESSGREALSRQTRVELVRAAHEEPVAMACAAGMASQKGGGRQ